MTFKRSIVLSLALVNASLGLAQQTDEVMPVYLSDRRALVMLQIGEHRPALVVFDTATTITDLDTSYAKSLALPDLGKEPVTDGTPNPAIIATTTVMRNAKIGGIAIGDAHAAVFDYEESGVVGIVGPNSFKGRLLYLELGKGRIRVGEKNPETLPAGKAHPYVKEGPDAYPYADITVAGTTVPALLDTGCDSALILPLASMNKLPLATAAVLIGKARTVTGDRDLYEGRLNGVVRVGPVTLRDPRVLFVGTEAIVGLPILRQMLIVIDPEGERSWLLEPRTLTKKQQREYVGRYGIRSIRIENGALLYQRDGKRPRVLTSLGGELFAMSDPEELVRFKREAGRVTGFVMIGERGGSTTVARTSAD